MFFAGVSSYYQLLMLIFQKSKSPTANISGLTASLMRALLNKRHSSPETFIHYLVLVRFLTCPICVMLSVDDTERCRVFRNVPDLQHRTKDATIGRSKDLRTERFLGIVLFDV